MDQSPPEIQLNQSTPETYLNQSPPETHLDQSPTNTHFNKSPPHLAQSTPETHLDQSHLGEEGCLLSDFIKRHQDNPSLKVINLAQYSMPETKWVELFQFTSTCKYMTHLCLSSSNVGEAGCYLAQAITSWGENPPLEKLHLRHCSMPNQLWPELLLSLSSCKQLTDLDLSNNDIGVTACYLKGSITSWGDNPQLQTLDLGFCSIPEQVWPELLQSLSSCKQLSHLDLSHNTIGEAGHYLAQSFTAWGNDPPFKVLYLSSCSIPEQVWIELLQSLSCCKQLSHLNLSANTIGEAGRYLAQSITSSGDESPLNCLYLKNCSIPKQFWDELFESLCSCKQLHNLDLSDNTIGEAGHYLAQLITSWGDNPPLQVLHLNYCLIPQQVWAELLQSLSFCKHLTDLDLSGNAIGEAGHYLAQSITTWGAEPSLQSLQELCLDGCSIPEHIWPKLLQQLSSCKHIKNLNLSRNTLKDRLSSFQLDSNPGLIYLEKIGLEETSINKADVHHLTQLIQANKLPSLKYLSLQKKSLTSGEEELHQLKKACASQPNGLIYITSFNSDEEEVKPQTSLQENKQVQKLNQDLTIQVFFHLNCHSIVSNKQICLNIIGRAKQHTIYSL